MNKTIMIIEDDVETQFLFSQLLEAEGYSVITKSHGQAALEFLSSHPLPDLIFMDLKFPKGTPEEFTTSFRKIKGAESTPIILVSGKADIQEYAVKLKATNYVRKPFEIAPILGLLKEVLT